MPIVLLSLPLRHKIASAPFNDAASLATMVWSLVNQPPLAFCNFASVGFINLFVFSVKLLGNRQNDPNRLSKLVNKGQLVGNHLRQQKIEDQ